MTQSTYVLDEALKALEKQSHRLQANQGRVARRNARRTFLGAMKALRNAMNEHFPRIGIPTDPEKYVVDIFEPAHREGHGKKSRMISDRWRVVRRADLGGYPSWVMFVTIKTKHHGSILGPMLPTNLKEATKFAHWCAKKIPALTFRLRRCGEKDGLVANVL